MKIKNAQPQTHLYASRINAAIALPFTFLIHLFAVVIDLMLNIPIMNAVWSERRELELLSDQHTKDIGLTPDCVRQEIKRSYFDIPHNRKRS